MPEDGYNLTKLAYSLPEVGELLGLGTTMIYSLAKKHKLRVVRVGRRRMVLAPDLTAFLNELRNQT